MVQVDLPHGAYVKVSISGQLINVWIVPSPTDLYMTEGPQTFSEAFLPRDDVLAPYALSVVVPREFQRVTPPTVRSL